MSKFKEGDVVRLKPGKAVEPKFVPEGRQNHKTAKVTGYLGQNYPGGVAVDRDLNGCLYWNEDDLLLCHNVADHVQDDALELALEVIRDCQMPSNFRMPKYEVVAQIKKALEG